MSDLADCTALLRGGSKSFHAASRLLPGTVRRAATALYAFCRVADDAVDGVEHSGVRADAVAALTRRLELIYQGRPQAIAADRAFADLVAAYQLPLVLPAALLEGFAWDADGRRYATFGDLCDYAARVAGSVGAMMAVVMGVRSAEVVARACELGVAMQLTNIARDVGEDAQAGRLYLPLAWLAEEGIDPDRFLAAPVFTPGLGRVVARLLREADNLYARAAPAIGHLPFACRPGIHAARLFYAAIGDAAAGGDFDLVSRRAVVSRRRKLGLVVRATAAAVRPAALVGGAALPAVAYLVEAAALPSARRRAMRPWRQAEERAVWVLELFASLDARQRAG